MFSKAAAAAAADYNAIIRVRQQSASRHRTVPTSDHRQHTDVLRCSTQCPGSHNQPPRSPAACPAYITYCIMTHKTLLPVCILTQSTIIRVSTDKKEKENTSQMHKKAQKA